MKSCGVFGSLSELDGKPWERTLNPGIVQSFAPRAGFAEASPHGVEKIWVTKKGGLKPWLGLE